jgi:flavin reductase (DIM6/NTAB) family NADH-FMN oxidoreductase RutF
MKKVITRLESFQYFYPYTVALVGARWQDKVNFMSCAWHTALSFNPPMFGVLVAKKRYTHEFLTGAGEFSVNFIGYGQTKLSARMGRLSGRERDKVRDFRVGLSPAMAINSPVVAEAYASLECRTVEVRTYGDHDLFVGEVLAVQHDERAFDSVGILDTRAFPPLLYLGSDFYITVKPESLAQVLPNT